MHSYQAPICFVEKNAPPFALIMSLFFELLSLQRLPDGVRLRGDIHALLLGDPSTAKS